MRDVAAALRNTAGDGPPAHRPEVGRESRTLLRAILGSFVLFTSLAVQAGGVTSSVGVSPSGAANRMSIGAFYDPGPSASRDKLGALIRGQLTTDYAVPQGVRVFRILYHSRSSSGKDVAASALVFLPPGRPPAGGWPVIGWAHPTTGVARICAPSLDRHVFYRSDSLARMVRAGFAVVATDYAGLGTAGPHEYLSLVAQADDVSGAVRAALRTSPELGSRWVAVGNAQGGAAVWALAQQESLLKDPGYLGAVAVGAPLGFAWTLQHTKGGNVNSFHLIYLAYAVHVRFPQFQVADMLSRSALARYGALTSRGCVPLARSMQQRGLLGESTVIPGWVDNPWIEAFAKDNSLLRPGVTRPVLLLSGGADLLVPPAMERAVARSACRLGYRLELHVYPKLSHDTLMAGSMAEQLRWIRGLFLSKPAQSNCAQLGGR